jgi:hypothetical protein
MGTIVALNTVAKAISVPVTGSNAFALTDCPNATPNIKLLSITASTTTHMKLGNIGEQPVEHRCIAKGGGTEKLLNPGTP